REQLASYPELIAVYHGLWRLTGERQWKDKALRMVVWYQSKQQKNGAFPYSPGSTFVYTRGTGKIFETLACFPEENKAMLEKVFAWLRTMQYTKENTFFMNQDEQTLLVGGFRHDAFNREAWIDASAHVILGATRLLNIQR
ncbi:MAG: hypothetical protein Q8O53_01755, partial [Candidatus Moranbacteria bacterium]|nr:hypothetical protein [Candidatus Moranbacteria bacterium]